MFFIMCLRSLVVSYSRDPDSNLDGNNVFQFNESCFQLGDALASGSRGTCTYNLRPEARRLG